MSIKRLPFTLAAWAGFYITYTAPNPTSEGEGKSVAEGPILYFKHVFKYLFSTLAAAEIVAIIANSTKEFPISHHVLAALMVGGDAAHIHITPVSLFGALLALFGGWVRKRCYREMGKQFTFELNIREDHKLVTTGPYAVVRHPSYGAAFLVLVGVICFHSTSGSWLRESGVLDTKIGGTLAYFTVAILTIPVVMIKGRWEKEDEALKKKFGKQWDEWAQRVPYAMLPGII